MENTKIIFTVSIPAYNRCNLLKRNLQGLEKQTFDKTKFEVIIVDDGSTDNTEEFVYEYIQKSEMNIIYHKQQNSGKFVALNYAKSVASGIFFINSDSDDYLNENCLTDLFNIWSSIDFENKKIAGIVGHNQNITTKKMIGTLFPKDNYLSDPIEMRFKYKVKGDKFLCFRTDIVKKYKFPETNRTKFIPESYNLYNISSQYSFLYVNKTFQNCDYQEGGLSSNIHLYRIKNSYGCYLVYKLYLDLFSPPKTYLGYLRNSLNYIRFALHAKENINYRYPYIILLFPIGFTLYVRDKMKIQ